MTERGHKILVALEATLLALPVTYLGGSLGLLSAVSIFGDLSEPYDRAQALVYALPILPLICGWVLIARFLLRGYAGLLSVSPYVIWVAIAGVVLVVAALLVGVSFDVYELGYSPTYWLWVAKYFRELGFGMPAIIPLAHLLILRGMKLPSEVKVHAL